MAFDAGALITAALMNRLLNDHALSATIATAENYSTTSYGDLPLGAGPSVTITSAGNRALILFSAAAFGTDATLRGQFVGVAISGATVTAATDAKCLKITSNSTGSGYRPMGFAFLTINPGLNTYTLKYKVSSGTGNFSARDIWVFAP